MDDPFAELIQARARISFDGQEDIEVVTTTLAPSTTGEGDNIRAALNDALEKLVVLWSRRSRDLQNAARSSPPSDPSEMLPAFLRATQLRWSNVEFSLSKLEQ